MIPLIRLLTIPAAGAALAGLSAAQGSFLFAIDTPSTSFVWGGTTDIGDIEPMPPTFTLQGTTEMLLTSGGSPVGTGQFAGGGDALVVPNLHGEIPNPIPIFPPLATIEVTDLHFVLGSAAFGVDGTGQFTAVITATAIHGTLTFTPLAGSPTITDLTGLSSDPATANGALTGASSLDLHLPLDVTFNFSDPGTGISGSVFLVGVMEADFDCPQPSTYCVTSPNSVGTGALIGSSGTTSIAANDLFLLANGLPHGQFGIFYYGPNQIMQPFGDGVRCVGGIVIRRPPVNSGPTGSVSFHLDHGALPPTGVIEAGDTENFQFWYRDPAFGGAGFNFSDALEVFFCP